MQFSKWTMGVGMLLGTLLPVSAEAQVVKNDKLLSFEDPQIPVFISGTNSRLEISDEHYKAHRLPQGKYRLKRYGHEISASLSGRNLRAYQ